MAQAVERVTAAHAWSDTRSPVVRLLFHSAAGERAEFDLSLETGWDLVEQMGDALADHERLAAGPAWLEAGDSDDDEEDEDS